MEVIKYWIYKDGRELGAFNLEELLWLPNLKESTLIWHNGLEGWSEFKDLVIYKDYVLKRKKLKEQLKREKIFAGCFLALLIILFTAMYLHENKQDFQQDTEADYNYSVDENFSNDSNEEQSNISKVEDENTENEIETEQINEIEPIKNTELISYRFKDISFELNDEFKKQEESINSVTYNLLNDELIEMGVRFDSQIVDSYYEGQELGDFITDLEQFANDNTQTHRQNLGDATLIDYGYKYIDNKKCIWVKQSTSNMTPEFESYIESLFIFEYPRIYSATIIYKKDEERYSNLVKSIIQSIDIK